MVETMILSHPRFAVVGHPNKGKSSIVSALCLDDTVQISDTPGTTVATRSFPLRVDGTVLYELFDTPGFQRPTKVLAWLQQHPVSADKKHEVVQAFIDEHRHDTAFHDEIELLVPIMEGAGIVYVVDGSKPYSQEYEAEMEILRYTGQPSMALINPIDTSDYTGEWKRALEQYFKIVRVFNPMTAHFEEHMALLESIAQLKQEWTTPMKHSIALFKEHQEHLFEETASVIARLVYEALSNVERLPLRGKEASKEEKEEVEHRYKNRLRALEMAAQKRVEHIWSHDHLQKEQQLLAFEGMDLFSQETASVFGLTRNELLVAAATSGASVGAGIDLLFVGHTLLLGAAIGAIGGAASAFLSFNELSEIKVLGQTLGRRSIEMGPMVNKNFPYILLGRALYHANTVIGYSHAMRSRVDMVMDSSFKSKWLQDEMKKSLEKFHTLFRAKEIVQSDVLEAYAALIQTILKRLTDA